MTARPDIARLIHQGLSNQAIARQLHIATKTVRAARTELGLPPSQHGYPQGLTLEQTWQARTKDAGNGHLAWTGAHSSSGTPGLNYGQTWHSARAIAFRIRTGRDPVGYAKSGCDRPWCVAPDHIDDTATRQRDRRALRAVIGMSPPPDQCPAGHDQAEHGRLDPTGVQYCAVCNASRKGVAA